MLVAATEAKKIIVQKIPGYVAGNENINHLEKHISIFNVIMCS